MQSLSPGLHLLADADVVHNTSHSQRNSQPRIRGALVQFLELIFDAIKDYERGTHLKKHCDEKLRQARERVDKINIGADGAVHAEKIESE